MKKLLSVLLCLCLCLLGCMPAFAEEEADADSFLLKIWDESGLPVSYLRFDVYIGGEYAGLVCSCPDEGEDFYRFPFSVSSPDELADIRIECSYGVSDLAPEDAILQVMMGKALEEHPLLTLYFMPEKGKTYDLKLIPDGEGTWKPVPFEAE